MKVEQIGPNQYTVSDLTDGEPIFVVRGNDAVSLLFIRFYAQLTQDYWSDSKRQSLDRVITQFKYWQQGHRPLIKMPD